SRQGLKVACIEEIALSRGLIDAAQFERLAEFSGAGEYGRYLRRILNERLTARSPSRAKPARRDADPARGAPRLGLAACGPACGRARSGREAHLPGGQRN